MGVNHAPEETDLPTDFVSVLAESELPEGGRKRVEAQGVPVLLYHHQGHIHAIAATCSHAGGPLDEGEITEHCVKCPWHGSAFDVRDGRVLDGPATQPQPVLEVRVQAGLIEVRGVS